MSYSPVPFGIDKLLLAAIKTTEGECSSYCVELRKAAAGSYYVTPEVLSLALEDPVVEVAIAAAKNYKLSNYPDLLRKALDHEDPDVSWQAIHHSCNADVLVSFALEPNVHVLRRELVIKRLNALYLEGC